MLPSNDVLARYGGEEFVALLSESDIHHASDVAERIRAAVEALDACFEQKRIRVTISIGVATFQPQSAGFDRNSNAEQLLKAADQALYRAKKNSRNRVGIATDAEPAG